MTTKKTSITTKATVKNSTPAIGRPKAFEEPTERLNLMLPADIVQGIKMKALTDRTTPGIVFSDFFRSVNARLPDDIRGLGWTVAVHNDYRLNGENCTFWLFTKGEQAVKGEGRTDVEALNQVRMRLREIGYDI